MIKNIKRKIGLVALITVLSSCGSGGSTGSTTTPTPTNLTTSEKIAQMTSDGLTCTSLQKTELKNSYAIDSTTKCIIPSMNGLQIVVKDDNAVLGTVDASTGAFTAYSGSATTLADEITAYNSAPQVENLAAGTFDKATLVLTGTQTSSDLTTLIAAWKAGTDLKSVINGEFDTTITGDVNQTIVGGTKKSVDLVGPTGATYTLNPTSIPIYTTAGADTGITATIALASGIISITDLSSTLANGTYDLKDMVVFPNVGASVTYSDSGKLVVNKCAAGFFDNGSGGCV